MSIPLSRPLTPLRRPGGTTQTSTLTPMVRWLLALLVSGCAAADNCTCLVEVWSATGPMPDCESWLSATCAMDNTAAACLALAAPTSQEMLMTRASVHLAAIQEHAASCDSFYTPRLLIAVGAPRSSYQLVDPVWSLQLKHHPTSVGVPHLCMFSWRGNRCVRH